MNEEKFGPPRPTFEDVFASLMAAIRKIKGGGLVMESHGAERRLDILHRMLSRADQGKSYQLAKNQFGKYQNIVPPPQ